MKEFLVTLTNGIAYVYAEDYTEKNGIYYFTIDKRTIISYRTSQVVSIMEIP